MLFENASDGWEPRYYIDLTSDIHFSRGGKNDGYLREAGDDTAALGKARNSSRTDDW